MNVVEEETDRLGRWFACYNDRDEEIFSARLFTETHELGIAWVSDLRQLTTAASAIQGVIKRDIMRIVRTASNGLKIVIKNGRFNPKLAQQRLSRRLGGVWIVEVSKRTGVTNEVWDLMAKRIGD